MGGAAGRLAPGVEEPPTSTAALAGLKAVRGAWAEQLTCRSSSAAAPSERATATFARSQDQVRKRTRARMGVPAEPEAGTVDEEGTGLPPAKRSRRAADLERWCVAGSWAMCEHCRVLQPRDMKPALFNNVSPKPCISQSQCWRCQAKRPHLAPSLDDVPQPLRGLTPETAAALAMLEVNTGPEVRSLQSNGYRQHAGMIRFSWHATLAIARLRDLSGEERERGLAAYRWLLANNTKYAEFNEEHMKFLREHPEPTDVQRRRWLRILEREAVECACWPHLFWQTELCFSVERLTDPRRVSRQMGALDTLEHRLFGDRGDHEDVDPYGDVEDAEDEVDTVMHSVRRSFAAKALGPLLDYGSSYDILHYVFDLTLWSTIGAKRNLGYEVPMRVLMAGHPMSPLYWRATHHALIDMVRQCGYPRLFVTKAPFEKSFPYHAFVEDQLAKQQRKRVRLPVQETLHLTHVLTELARGFITGQNEGEQKKRWKRHLLQDPAGNKRVALMSRIEFQDGTHKSPTQDYHGSGRPHLHFVVCAERPDL